MLCLTQIRFLHRSPSSSSNQLVSGCGAVGKAVSPTPEISGSNPTGVTVLFVNLSVDFKEKKFETKKE